jgi:hypothetical protein
LNRGKTGENDVEKRKPREKEKKGGKNREMEVHGVNQRVE